MIKDTIEAIVLKHKTSGIEIHAPATLVDLNQFEQSIGFPLPADFKAFYTTCNGFACNEDQFNMVPLGEIIQSEHHYGAKWFYFSEYMIYADMWGVRLTTDGNYEIFNGSYPTKAMTSSLEKFLDRLLKGNVFDRGGLYDWQEELQIGGE